MAQKSGSSHPMARRNVKDAQFSRFFWNSCEMAVKHIYDITIVMMEWAGLLVFVVLPPNQRIKGWA